VCRVTPTRSLSIEFARRCESCKTPCCFPDESTENTACRGHIPTRIRYAASRTWRFCSEAGILQLSQWRTPVASLHFVNWRSAVLWRVSVIRTVLMFGQMRILTRSFQLPYTFSVWCAVLDDQMIGPLSSKSLLDVCTFELCGRNCPNVWKMCLWINDTLCNFNVTKLLFIFHVQFEIFWTMAGRWIGRGVKQLSSQVSIFRPISLLCFGIDERNGLQREGWNARRIARSHDGYGRSSQ